MKNTVLITGGAGYIGSHAQLAFLEKGYQVVIIDNLVTGRREAISKDAIFIEDDIRDREALRSIFTKYKIQGVIHFAGSIVVPESVSNPLKYYDNNTVASKVLIEECLAHQIKNFIFSSTAAIYGYGHQSLLPISETLLPNPINPYGRSKLMTEWMLEDVSRAHDFNYCALRYFNVAGADPKLRVGQSTPEATHLIKVACETALGKRKQIEIFGTDYPTADGTCIRDYIHVTDLVNAHVLALEYISQKNQSLIMNCGYNAGFSVRQVLKTVERLIGKKLPVKEGPRRAGDSMALVSETLKIKEILNWQPQFNDLDFIVKTAYDWENKISRP